jgi:hypothetical protein
MHINIVQIDVSMEPFKDTDIEDLTQSKDVMGHYEWAFADKSALGRLLTKWTRLSQRLSKYDNSVSYYWTISPA